MSDVRLPVPDQSVRDDIADRHDRTLFVEAGAGTGKTSSLVERVISLVRAGVPIEDLAVITFTEAAAAELRDRVRGQLDTPSPSPEEAAALAGLDGAAISTLHGFAQRILAEHPLEAGLPPVIEVHSEIGAEVEFERRWRLFLDALLDRPDHEEVVQRAIVCGIELRHLKALARILEDEWDRLPDAAPPRPPLARVELEAVVAPLREALVRRTECLDESDRMLGALAERESWLRTAAGADTDLQRLDALVTLPTGSVTRVGSKANWRTGALDEVRELLGEGAGARDAALTRAVDEVLRHLLDEIGRFTLRGVAERRSAGRLHFHDLLVMARDLLRQSPTVRRQLHERYRYLLIDEFQDTDPIQIEIARLIACPDDHVGDRPWTELPTEPGRLFFVGDAKQSIYRFRRADIGLFLTVRDGDGAEERVLSSNFRTVPGIVEWVNRAFAEIMGEGTPQAQPAYHPLSAQRRPPERAAAPVVVTGGPLAVPKAPDRRAVMGDDLAGALHRAMDEAWPVLDQRTGEWRDPRWSDMAVLIPARTGLPELRAAFDRADVPYRIEASSLVWLTQEVRELLAVLRAVDDPTDALALVATLRSPAFACGDDDLARYVTAGGRLELDRRTPEALPDDDPVVAALRSLRGLRDAAVWDEPSALVERVIRERHLMEVATATRRPRDVWRRLRFVADQARAYADAEGGTLRDFLDWTDLQADETARVSETVLPETDDDAVRVLTIHASKGLEFPIVAVAGLDRQPAEPRHVPTILWDATNRPEASLRSWLVTAGYADLKAREDELEAHEAWRLMYVATTRARDHLVLCLHHKEGADPAKNVGARLHQLCQRHPDLWRTPDTAPSSEPVQGQLALGEHGELSREPGEDGGASADGATGGAESGAPSRAEWIRRRTALLAEAARPSVVAATAVGTLGSPGAGGPDRHEDDRGDDADPDVDADADAEPWRRGRAGTSIGRAVHATLQTVNLATGEDLPSIAAAQASAEGIPERAAEVERSARAALAAPAVVTAAGRRHWRELYLGATVEGVLCEGYIDLLVDGPDGLEIIDYKTDRAPDPQALVERYRLQTATYALMVEATLQRPVRRCLLVVLGSGGATEVEIDDLDAATEEVRRILRREGRPLESVGTRADGDARGVLG